MKYLLFNKLFLSFTLLFVAHSLFAQPSWEQLGSRSVNYQLDRDEIAVGAQEGRYAKLKLVVRGGSLNMHKMVVVYGNGKREEISLRHHFGRRSSSRVIDLNGNKRVIRKIIFWYESANQSRRKATLSVFGR